LYTPPELALPETYVVYCETGLVTVTDLASPLPVFLYVSV
jgi:hypothetical protein